jgi:hypothetical protein
MSDELTQDQRDWLRRYALEIVETLPTDTVQEPPWPEKGLLFGTYVV